MKKLSLLYLNFSLLYFYIYSGCAVSRHEQEPQPLVSDVLMEKILNHRVLIVPCVSTEPLTDTELDSWLDNNIIPERAKDYDLREYFAQFKDRPELFKARCRLASCTINQPLEITVRNLLPRLEEDKMITIITHIVHHYFDRTNMLLDMPTLERNCKPYTLDTTQDMINVLVARAKGSV